MRRLAMDAYRFSAIVLLSVSGCLAASAVFAAESTSAIADYQPGTPFAYLFDTGSRSARPLSPNVLAAKEGWALIPEDDTEHEFLGDAVLLNDKLTVVLRTEGPGAEVYSQAPGGARFRAVVMAAPRKAVAVTGLSSLRIVENSLGAVMVEADFQGDGQSGTCTAGYRLTTGQAMLQMTGLGAADRFFVWSVTRYVVVPDFFADDMVFSAAGCDLNRFGLPAESFLLNLLDGGDAMLTCVWRSANRDAYAVLTGEGPERRIRGCEFTGGEDETLWVAVLEGADIWHDDVFTAERSTLSTWKPPFDAMWRVDAMPAEPFTRSLEGPKPNIEGALYCDPDHPDPAAKARGDVFFPFVKTEPAPVVVYPLDRDAATPLTTFCPVDVLRNTLGVGPCQYILQTEGLASDANPTPANVMDWVQEQFDQGKEAESADQIRERLRQMIAHMEQTQARIDEYGALAKELDALCVAAEPNEPVPPPVYKFGLILVSMQESIAMSRMPAEPPVRASEMAERIIDLIGKDNGTEKCFPLAQHIAAIGSVQDKTLSECRMRLRWLRQQARMSAIKEPASAALAKEIQRRVERFLAEKRGSAKE